MAPENLSEAFWRNVKFFMIFVIFSLLIFIGLTKYILKEIPKSNYYLLEEINKSEKVLLIQKENAKKAHEYFKEIEGHDFTIRDEYKLKSIRGKIKELPKIFENYDKDNKYLFKYLLEMFLNTMQEQNVLDRNIKQIKENWELCASNVERDD
jgi:hypothetical protein